MAVVGGTEVVLGLAGEGGATEGEAAMGEAGEGTTEGVDTAGARALRVDQDDQIDDPPSSCMSAKTVAKEHAAPARIWLPA